MPLVLNRSSFAAGRLLLTAGGLALAAQLFYFLFGLATWLDEGNYLYGATAFVRHGIKLYSERLPCWYTPLYFVALGWWQEIAGLGLRPGRLFSVLCFCGALGFLTTSFPERKQPAAAYLWLAVLSPAVALYHASVSQFAFVNLQIAALLWTLFHPGRLSRDLRWLAAGLLTGTILMTRPNYLLLLPLLMVAEVWLHGRPGPRSTGFFLAALLGVSGLIVGIFGPGAFWNLIRTYPGAGGLARVLGLTADPAVGPLDGADLGLRMQAWWASRPETFRGIHEWFLEGVIWPYLPLLLANAFALDRWRQRGFDRSPDAAMALLFFASVLLHFAATQTFCRSCALPYVNYSLIFGLAGGAPSAWDAANAFRQSLADAFRDRTWLSWPTARALLISALVLLPSVSAFTADGMYRKWIDFQTPAQVRTLAAALASAVPPEAEVLPLGMDIRLTEAIHLSGRLADPLLINYIFSLRDPMEADAVFSDEAQARIRARGLWTKELMRDWLRERHRHVLFREGGVIDLRCREILAERFDVRPLLPEAPPESFSGSYRLAIRRTVSSTTIPTTP
ncbi:MAG: hypothetical protein KGS60_12475 [Verrucomicrobia bacterium]|nr:hypothetical protein [Verrucomicrobiota bacterium]